MDYDPERALWVPRWGRRGFMSLGLGALAALALSVPVESMQPRTWRVDETGFTEITRTWLKADRLWIAA